MNRPAQRPAPASARTSRTRLAGGLPRGALVAAVVLCVLATSSMTAWAAARAVAVTLGTSQTQLLPDQTPAFSGTAKPSPVGSVVQLERWSAGAWRIVAQTRTGSAGAYSFRFKPAAGDSKFRVVRPATTGYTRGVSPVVKLWACGAMSAPTGGSAVWFTQLPSSAPSAIGDNLTRLFCAAAPRSRIRIAMYFIRDTGEVDQILRALELVKRYRGVSVQFVLDDWVYRSGTEEATLARLRSLGTVTFCENACRYETPGQGLQHNKFVTMSDMVWRSTAPADPVVVSSSANWSAGQLRNHWQSAQVFYDDVSLTREFDIRWRNLQVCGLSGCAAWSPAAEGLDPQVYGMERYQHPWRDEAVWVDPNLGERPGAPGRGSQVLFTPIRRGSPDPVTTPLQGFTCTAAHRTVRVATLVGSLARPAFQRTLHDLKKRRCDVRVVISAAPTGTAAKDAVDSYRELGIPVNCVPHMHDKIMYLDVVSASTGSVQKHLWTGSTNATFSGLHMNDEVLLRLSWRNADTAHRPVVLNQMSAYLNQWETMADSSVGC